MTDLPAIPRTSARCATLRDTGTGAGLAVLLPGFTYTCNRPLLARTAALLRGRGWRVWELHFAYAGDAAFKAAGTRASIRMIEADGAAILAQALHMAPDGPFLFVGKSLGTLSMGGMVAAGLPERAGLIWLTPLLTGTPLMARMQAAGRRAFSLIGSNDPAAAATSSPAFRAIANLTHVTVPGMDHGWNHPDGAAATARGLQAAITALGDWLDHPGKD